MKWMIRPNLKVRIYILGKPVLDIGIYSSPAQIKVRSCAVWQLPISVLLGRTHNASYVRPFT